jgi:hypothetical protein
VKGKTMFEGLAQVAKAVLQQRQSVRWTVQERSVLASALCADSESMPAVGITDAPQQRLRFPSEAYQRPPQVAGVS